MCGLCQHSLTPTNQFVVDSIPTADLASLLGPAHIQAQRRHREQYARVVRPSIVSLAVRVVESATALRLIEVLRLPPPGATGQEEHDVRSHDGDSDGEAMQMRMRWRLTINSPESSIWWLKAMALHPVARPMSTQPVHAIFALSLESIEGSLDMSWAEANLLARSRGSEEGSEEDGGEKENQQTTRTRIRPQELIWQANPGQGQGRGQGQLGDDTARAAVDDGDEERNSSNMLINRLESIQQRVISQLERVALIDSRLRQVTLAPYDDLDVGRSQLRGDRQGQRGDRGSNNSVEVVIDALLDALAATVENAELWTREWLRVMRQGTAVDGRERR